MARDEEHRVGGSKVCTRRGRPLQAEGTMQTLLGRTHSALRHMGMNGEFNFRGAEPGEDSLLSIPEQRCRAGPPPGERAIALDVGIQGVPQCATCHYRHRAGAEDSQTPVRNSDPMAVESRGDLASRHGSIGHFAAAHSWSYRSDNPICTRTPFGKDPAEHSDLARIMQEIRIRVDWGSEKMP